MSDTSFTLSWQSPETDGGSPILEYVVERREVNKKAWQKVSDCCILTSVLLRTVKVYSFSTDQREIHYVKIYDSEKTRLEEMHASQVMCHL
jgi:hypothetical protein